MTKEYILQDLTHMQQSPTFLAPGTTFIDDNLFQGLRLREMVQDDSSTLSVLCFLFFLI